MNSRPRMTVTTRLVECEVTPAAEILSLSDSSVYFGLQWNGSVQLSGSALATSLIAEHNMCGSTATS